MLLCDVAENLGVLGLGLRIRSFGRVILDALHMPCFPLNVEEMDHHPISAVNHRRYTLNADWRTSSSQLSSPGRVVSGNSAGDSSGRNGKDVAKLTVAELREECRRRGLRNVSKLKKDELISLLRGEQTQMIHALALSSQHIECWTLCYIYSTSGVQISVWSALFIGYTFSSLTDDVPHEYIL